MKQFNIQRWNHLCAAAGVTSTLSFHDLLAHYSEPHRAYHNARHVDECLGELDTVKSQAIDPIAVEFTIWFHDVIYNPRATDNEEKSATLAQHSLQPSNSSLALSVSQLLITTKTHLPASVPGAPLLLDIDLSILGKAPDRFAQFESDIRSEYSWVPSEIYRAKRADILRGFLDRPRIYLTESFYRRYETVARQNLSALISTLERVT